MLLSQRGDGAQRHQLVVRSGDVDIFQLLGIQALDALDLRNHLVAAPVDVEAVDEIAADAAREIGADLLHVEAERGDLVAVDHDFATAAGRS